ncbi:MAG: hypothetical protein ACXACF_11830 [Candidatus Hermodarchaeia archaeon]|jgi:hypothetical protein
MQIAPILFFVAGTIAAFLIRFSTLTLAIFFSGRIMGGEIVTLRDAFIGASIVVVAQEVVWWIMFFVFPSGADFIVIVVGVIALILTIIKFYDFGCFGATALVMLAVVMFSAVEVMSVAFYYIFFVPPP